MGFGSHLVKREGGPKKEEKGSQPPVSPAPPPDKLLRTEEAFHVDQHRRPLSAEATQHFQRIVLDQAAVFHG